MIARRTEEFNKQHTPNIARLTTATLLQKHERYIVTFEERRVCTRRYYQVHKLQLDHSSSPTCHCLDCISKKMSEDGRTKLPWKVYDVRLRACVARSPRHG